MKPGLRYVCCELGCDASGEFALYALTGTLEDSTVACTQHVGILLGTITTQPWGSYYWQVHVLEVAREPA